MHNRGVWEGMRPLSEIIEAPSIRPDGSIIDRPGYDPATHTLLVPCGSFPPIPLNPTLDDAKAAWATLDDLLYDFEIETPAHKAVWLASLLSLVGRPAIRGYVPLFWIEANASRAGKTLLVDLISLIATGRTAPRSLYTRSNEEMRKAITSWLLEGARLRLLDNVRAIVESTALEAALTGGTHQDRLLGFSETTGELRNRMVWFMTANQGRVGGDLPNRTVLCRLKTVHEYPQDRTDFRHPDLVGYVRANRGQLLVAALTILLAHAKACRPDRVRALGGFENWSEVVASAVLWTTGFNPLDTCEEIKTTDESRAMLRVLIEQLAVVLAHDVSLSASQVLNLAKETTNEGLRTPALARPELWEALHFLGGENVNPDWLPSPEKLGREFAALAGREIAGWRLVEDYDSYKKQRRWKVRQVQLNDCPHGQYGWLR